MSGSEAPKPRESGSPRVLLDEATAEFDAAFGGSPEGAWWAPGRVNLIGEHTDYNGGLVLPLALPTGTVAVARRRDDNLVRMSSQGVAVEVAVPQISPQAQLGWAAYVAGVGWAAAHEGHDVPGLDIAFAADVPRGAGLSSSASLSCSTASAWNDLAGWCLPGRTVARLGRMAENEIAGAPTGTMDQLASVLCEAGHALKLDTLTNDIEQVPFDLDAAGLALLVVNSHAPHQLVDGEYGERRAACEQAADLLGVSRGRLCADIDGRDVAAVDARLAGLPDVPRRRARHVILDSARVEMLATLLSGGVTRAKAPQIGELFSASHRSMRDDFEITVPAVDALAAALGDGGAYGARMTGGGFGGCVIALIDTDGVDEAVARAGAVAAQHGFPEPEPFVATASAGAHRLR